MDRIGKHVCLGVRVRAQNLLTYCSVDGTAKKNYSDAKVNGDMGLKRGWKIMVEMEDLGTILVEW